MQTDDLLMIERQIHANRFGIMKLSGSMGSTLRLLVEVHRIEDNFTLFCTTSDNVKRLRKNKAYVASLRLVNKDDDTYTIVEGYASFKTGNSNLVELQFEIKSQKSFKKKQVSKFTSFLESITPRKAGKLIPGGSYYTNHQVA